MTGRVAENRRARHDYQIQETVEAGLILTGSEVKSLRSGRASIAESYASEENGNLVLINANIPIYPAARENHEPKRMRTLLMKAKERDKYLNMIRRDGYTLVPLSLYFNQKGVAKLSIGLAKGRKKHDKREASKQRDWDRQKHRLLKEH
ncbi:MAG: SsrA-binding protein SmpB [SAR116 cluster bacterium]|nr:MAG: SsrA-binding protein SmpB [SAR116 cluster bacterium]